VGKLTPAPSRYAMIRSQRTDFGRPAASIQFSIATPTQPGFTRRPVLYLERHLRDVVTTVDIMFVRHQGGQGQEMEGHPTLGPPKCTNAAQIRKGPENWFPKRWAEFAPGASLQ
jgi:hypothetical protein